MVLKILLPFTYFYFSRLKTVKDVLFHTYYEWVPNVLLIYILTDSTIFESLINFAVGYLAFISIYELGYFYNDFKSIKNEIEPRKRGHDLNLSKLSFVLLVLFRLVIFFIASFYLIEQISILSWIGLYSILAVIFTTHNLLKNKELKVFTFIGLAFLRFILPITIWIPKEAMSDLLIAIFLNYVFFRTISYMDSKNVLVMPSRQKAIFRIQFYLIMAVIGTGIFILTSSLYSVLFSSYFLIFWMGIFIIEHTISIKTRN